MDNLEIWEQFKKVPENAQKSFSNGRFKGTDINTMWRMKCLTEKFGACGIGWYFVPKRLWTETTTNSEQFAFAEIELFIKVDGEWSKPISGNGGNKLTRLTNDDTWYTSDEAYKMAVTDAFGVACRNLGIGADVYWENDRTKYTENEQFNTSKKPAVLGGVMMFNSGKYEGKRIIDVIELGDIDYLKLLLHNEKVSGNIRENIRLAFQNAGILDEVEI